jgi:hypoxanthine phosphoribosyltransferase
MKFVSYQEFNIWALELAQVIPNKYDLIVGIPRAGLMFASMLSTKFGRPLTVPDYSWAWRSPQVKLHYIENILVCDDAISSGNQMNRAVRLIKYKYPNTNVETAAVIKHEESKVDYFHSITSDPKLFEWNIAHVKLGKLACDIDGVLCPDLPVGFEEEEHPEGYEDHIYNAMPQFIPQYKIDTVISCRIERWRKGTEIWLHKNGVKYNRLILWNTDVPSDRNGKWADYKVQRIGEFNAEYAFESNREQAIRIHEELRIPVLCYKEMEMLSD